MSNSKFKFLSYDQAHEYVKQNRQAHWEGWDIVIFKPNKIAQTRTDGMRYNGVWGLATRIKVTDRGTWRVPLRK